MSIPTVPTPAKTAALDKPGRPYVAPDPRDLIGVMTMQPPLSPGARLVYTSLLILGVDGDEDPPSRPEIAVMIGVAERSLGRWLAELRDRHLVYTTRRGRGSTQLYILQRPWSRPATSTHDWLGRDLPAELLDYTADTKKTTPVIHIKQPVLRA